MSVLRETTRVIVIRVLTRAGTIQETRHVTWEALPENAEVWPLAVRGIQHIRIRVNRDAMLPYGARIDEVGSVDTGSVGQSLSFPSSPSAPSPPVNNSSSRAAPSVSSPALEICLLYTSPSPRD